MGVFELAPFAAGHEGRRRALTEVDGFGVVGGGDSAAAVRALGFKDDQFGHISTGGGASLEFLEGKQLAWTGGPRMAKAVARVPADRGQLEDEPRPPAGDRIRAEARMDAEGCQARLRGGGVEVAVFPPFTDLRTVQTLISADKLDLAFGAQDVSEHDSGAYTGEISGAFLKALDCTLRASSATPSDARCTARPTSSWRARLPRRSRTGSFP